MHWDYADGYLGIGTATPTSALEVNGTIRTKLIQTTDTSLAAFTFIDLDMDTGASSGTNNLVLGGVNNVDFLIDTNNNSTASAFVYGTNANTMSSATELMRLNESGQLLISATSTSFSDKFYINNTAYSTGGFRTGTAATFTGKMYNNSGKLSLEADTDRDIQFGDAGTPAVMYIDLSLIHI